MKTTKSNFTTSSAPCDPIAMMDSVLSLAPSSEWLGLINYEIALEIQNTHWSEVFHNQSEGLVLGLEHPTVITLGSRGNPVVDCNSVLASVQTVQTDRGGQATLHSPGQLVIYPVVSLRRLGLGVREFVEILQITTQQLLNSFEIPAIPADGAGLQTERGKIAFIGLRIDRGICRHGLSLNVGNDLGLFQQIRSCGVQSARLDRMADYPAASGLVDLQPVFQAWMGLFARNLSSASGHSGLQKPADESH